MRYAVAARVSLAMLVLPVVLVLLALVESQEREVLLVFQEARVKR